MTETTFSRWRKKFGGMTVSDASGCGSWRRKTPASNAYWRSAILKSMR
jgi:hypothetical protein